MTVEHRIVVGLGDIKAVVFQCNQCAARVAVSPDRLDEDPRIMEDCPACKNHWWPTDAAKLLTQPVLPSVAFLRALEQMRTSEVVKEVGFTISLEFDEPQPLARVTVEAGR